jgi:hypothetical protein
MSRIYHKPSSEPREGEAQRLKREGAKWVAAVGGVLEGNPWLYYLGSGVLIGLWGGGVALIAAVGGRAGMALGGVLVILGGLVEIVLSPALARAREACPVWLRFWEEGWWGMIDYGPGVFRFIGSAVAGVGFGVIAYAIVPSETVAGVVGVAACIGVWIWTWFAFPGYDDEV